MNVKTLRNTLAAAAIATGALFGASLVKTPKQADVAETTVKTEQTYQWNPQQSVVANVKDGAVTTYNVATDAIKEGTDKATDHPAPLGAALAFELMGVGAAGAAMKRKNAQNIAERKNNIKVEIEDNEKKLRDYYSEQYELKERIKDLEKEKDNADDISRRAWKTSSENFNWNVEGIDYKKIYNRATEKSIELFDSINSAHSRLNMVNSSIDLRKSAIERLKGELKRLETMQTK